MFGRALKSRLALPLCPPYPGGRQTTYNWDVTSADVSVPTVFFSILFFPLPFNPQLL